MGARGEVVDDVRPRAGDEPAGRGWVAQVERGRGRSTQDLVPRRLARRDEMAPGEPGRAGDEDPQRQLRDTTYSADPWPFEAAAAGSIGRGSDSGGFRRRSSSPSTVPKSRWRQVACANAAPEPQSAGRSSEAGWMRDSAAVPGQVARCSARPASGPRTTAGIGSAGPAFAYTAPNTAPLNTCIARPMG